MGSDESEQWGVLYKTYLKKNCNLGTWAVEGSVALNECSKQINTVPILSLQSRPHWVVLITQQSGKDNRAIINHPHTPVTWEPRVLRWYNTRSEHLFYHQTDNTVTVVVGDRYQLANNGLEQYTGSHRASTYILIREDGKVTPLSCPPPSHTSRTE